MPFPGIGPNDNRMLRRWSVFPINQGLPVENAFAGALPVGTLVYVSGVNTTTKRLKVTKADADAAGPANVATYVVTKAMVQGGFGTVARAFVQYNVDTSGYTLAGDPAYLSATEGETTPTAPTAAAANVQVVGYCAVKSSTEGVIVYDLLSNQVTKRGSGSFQAGAVAAESVGNTAAAAAGALTAGNFGVPLVLPLTIANAASGNNDFTGLPYKVRVIDAWVQATAAGDAANTYQVQTSGGTAVTDAMTPAGGDNDVARAAEIVDATSDFAAGATIRVAHVRNAASSAAIVYVKLLRIA